MPPLPFAQAVPKGAAPRSQQTSTFTATDKVLPERKSLARTLRQAGKRERCARTLQLRPRSTYTSRLENDEKHAESVIEGV